MPRKIFTAGEVLAAADVNTFLMDQAVMTFADSTARGSAIGSATQGMVTYLENEDEFQYWAGTAYKVLGSGPAPTPINLVDFVLIAGGGGGAGVSSGGAFGAGAGGAGGYRSSVFGESSGGGSPAERPLRPILGTNYSVTIGAGGAAGLKGGNSSFGLISCEGGGLGRSGAGGSGGGADDITGAGGTGTAQQGFNGGNSSGTTSPGGGGGAGGAGGSGTRTGGIGVSSSITGTAVGRAGGGGGGYGGTATSGGGAGGAAGNNDGSVGTVNTGGGGGGAAVSGSTRAGGAGGSGVLILRYPETIVITIGSGLVGSTATLGTEKVTTITGGTGNISWAAA
jgi:hypothetical protein